jgi:hypothetical protein
MALGQAVVHAKSSGVQVLGAQAATLRLAPFLAPARDPRVSS